MESSKTLATADDERSLIARIAGGDRSAFAGLMRRYNRRLYRLAHAVLGEKGEAEDALQEAYLNAFRALGEFRGDASLPTWLSRLVLNECLGRQRRKHRRENVVPMVSSDSHTERVANVADDSEPPDAAYGRSQMRQVLELKVEELPELYRVVFVLRSVEELSVQETAHLLGVPEETVRSRHFRAKGLLRESLARDLDLAERDLFQFGGQQCDRIIDTVLSRLST